MKILILGDIHGRPFWRDIIGKENPDLTIFLGDYVTTHELYTAEQQLVELEAILDYKEANPGKVIMLRGNHDLDGLGYYWAQCYPSAADVRGTMSKERELGKRFLKNTQWLYGMSVAGKPTICAHAGVTNEWLEQELKITKFTPETIDIINAMEPDEHFGFTGGRWDNYGTDPQQSCVWIRPQTLDYHHVPGFDQIVGHTGTYGSCECHKMFEQDGDRFFEGNDVLWECDALQQKAYLIIEDGKYIPRTLDGNN